MPQFQQHIDSQGPIEVCGQLVTTSRTSLIQPNIAGGFDSCSREVQRTEASLKSKHLTEGRVRAQAEVKITWML